MPSTYQNEAFAAFWNAKAGTQGEPYKRYVLDPLLMELAKPLYGQSVLELGSGNGYLAPVFLEHGVRQLTLMDISAHNLLYAKEKCRDPRVIFLEHDATTPWPIPNDTLDILYSNMMLNEVENIETPIAEAFRTLKPLGKFLFSVTHPAWDLFVFAQDIAGKKSKKIKNLGGYFRRGMASFTMSNENHTNVPAGTNDAQPTFDVEHYQRPVSDYFSVLRQTGFMVTDLLEPELPDILLKKHPGFTDYADHPVGLVFKAVKPEKT